MATDYIAELELLRREVYEHQQATKRLAMRRRAVVSLALRDGGMTQTQVARALSVTRQRVAKIVEGETHA